MFLKVKPFIYSLIFLIGLEMIILMHSNVWYVLVFLFITAIYQGRMIGGKWIFSVLPAMLAVSSIALLYLIGIWFEQQLFIILASFMFYLSIYGSQRLGEYDGDQTAKGMNTASTAATIFFTYAGVYGLYLNFNIPLWSLMFSYVAITYLVSYQNLIITNNENKRKVNIYSFLLALSMSEIIWTMNFWPFGYLTTGAIALILYYVLWDIIQNYFLDNLSHRRIMANSIFFALIILIILLSSKWTPVI